MWAVIGFEIGPLRLKIENYLPPRRAPRNVAPPHHSSSSEGRWERHRDTQAPCFIIDGTTLSARSDSIGRRRYSLLTSRLIQYEH